MFVCVSACVCVCVCVFVCMCMYVFIPVATATLAYIGRYFVLGWRMHSHAACVLTRKYPEEYV